MTLTRALKLLACVIFAIMAVFGLVAACCGYWWHLMTAAVGAIVSLAYWCEFEGMEE